MDSSISSTQTDCLYKIIIFGDGGVGKTTLVKRYLMGIFDTSTTMTIGVDFYVKKIRIEDLNIKLQIWDFAGEDRFRFLLPSYVYGAAAGIYMFDITRYTSLKSFDDWLNIFREGYHFEHPEAKLPVMMLGGKLDLAHKRSVSVDKAESIARSQNLFSYMECSAKTGQNVELLFEKIAVNLLQRSGMF